MTEQMKYIVAELNKEPYKKNFNLISFDQLDNNQLLQILSDAIGVVEQKDPTDVRSEDPSQTFMRFSQVLRILKYSPPGNPNEFRNGLVGGEKNVIYPILEWLFRNSETCKKRAYLARYLLKIEIPSEVLDQDLIELYQQYDDVVEQFKQIHKEHEQLRKTRSSAQEIRRDIVNMEEEKETLIKRVERLQKKVETMSHPKKDEIYILAKQLRSAKERESELANQKHEQKTAIIHLEQRHARLTEQLQKLKASGHHMTPENLIRRLEDENKASAYMVSEKLPKDLDQKKASVTNLQKIVSEPAMSQSDLDEIHNKIQSVNDEISAITEKRMLAHSTEDDKLAIFRQQAAIIARKKEAAAEKLAAAKNELQRLESEFMHRKGYSDDMPLTGDDFKKYVAMLRAKSMMYKKKRQELSEVRAECGVLQRTEEILRHKDAALSQQVEDMENKSGVRGFRDMQDTMANLSEQKANLDNRNVMSLDELTETIKKLNQKVNMKKNALAPLIRDLRPKRQTADECRKQWEEKKERYESTSAGYESQRSRLEQEVRGLLDEENSEESKYHYMVAMKQLLEVKMSAVQGEMKADKSNSHREQLQKLISQEESETAALREKMNGMKDSFPSNVNQMKVWKDLLRLMETKLSLQGHVYGAPAQDAHVAMMGAGAGNMPLDTDRLVL